MAIITPLKKIFNWQTASEKIPYKVYTAYITTDENENMYASKTLENTIGTIKFISDPTGLNVGYWKLVLPYEVPRCNIMIPGYSNWWSNGAPMAPIYSNPSKSYGVVINPGYHPTSNDPINSLVDHVEIYTVDTASNTSVSWYSAFGAVGASDATSISIEVRVYN